MSKFSVCIEMLFADRPFLERIESVSAAGYPAFEFWGWTGKDLAAIKASKERLGLDVAAIVWASRQPEARDWGVRRMLLDAADHPLFLRGLEETLEVAHFLNCRRVIVLAGNTRTDLSLQTQRQNLVLGLKAAARLVEGTGVTLVLEPLNVLVDHAGYFLTSSTEAADILREVDRPQVRMLFDIYHQQISEGNIIEHLTRHMELIAHVHAADVPGRHQPGTGELNYANIFRALDRTGYEGYVGLEYEPLGDHMASLTAVKSLIG